MSDLHINLYTNNSMLNQRYKDLTGLLALTGTLREESSVTDPIIRVESSSNLSLCNYMYIQEFNRYYFITEPKATRANLWTLRAHCDVLSSAGLGLDTCKGIVRRSETDWNLYLDDGVFKAYSDPLIVQKEFPSGFDLDDATYILAVAGS